MKKAMIVQVIVNVVNKDGEGAIVFTAPPNHASAHAERAGVVRPVIQATLSRFLLEANDGC
jgi:hypothetical protein